MPKRLAVAGAVAVVLAATACSQPSAPGDQPGTSVRVRTTGASAVQSGTPSAVRLITVPDVSGMNHQQAQDTMQAAGLYNLREVDGTGQGRALIVDRNWVQVGQDPPAGTRVRPDTVVTLTAVKYTDR